MDETPEDPVNENNAITTGENKGSQRHKAPKRRSKVTVVRVALVLTAVLIVVYVIDLIMHFMYRHTTTKEKTEVMEETTPVPVTPCTNITVQCDEGWELHGQKCYYFSPNTVKLSWNNSSERCQQLRGNLVKIESEEEQTFLVNKLKCLLNTYEDTFWIGLTDLETEGEWLWTDSSRLNTRLAFWAYRSDGREPDNWRGEDPQGEDCVRMGQKTDPEMLCWYDKSCLAKLRIICEKPPRNC